MLPTKFQNSTARLKCIGQTVLNNNYRIIRELGNTETLEPVQLSYATYESTTSNVEASETPPLIILHGLFGSKSNWNSLCKVYQQKTKPQKKIIAVDCRNHGDSPHTDNHTYAHLAADVRHLMEQLNMKKAALMGHSMGGRAVMLIALKYPELVERLIVADISPVTTSPHLNSMPALFQALENVKLPTNMSMTQARAMVDAQLSDTIPDKSVRAFLLTNLVPKDNGSYSWRVNIPALLSNFNNIARFPLVNDLQFKGPVLFLGGGMSDFIQTKSQRPISLLPNDDKLDLAYASYEMTNSYEANKREPTPLVVLHGLMGSKNNWNSFCKRYHENTKCKVFALDARNHGDSPHSREHSYDSLVIDIRRFLQQAGMKKVFLLGHSMGGRAAMLFALKYPELVERLIVVDMSPITTSNNFKSMTKLLEALRKIEFPRNVPFSQAKRLVGENLTAVTKSRAVKEFLLTNLVQKSNGSYGWRFNANAILNNFEDITSFPELHHIVYEGPVLFVGGAKSDYIQKSDYPQILKLFPNAELQFIEGAGHWLHSEKPAEFLTVTLNFLNEKVPPTN